MHWEALGITSTFQSWGHACRMRQLESGMPVAWYPNGLSSYCSYLILGKFLPRYHSMADWKVDSRPLCPTYHGDGGISGSQLQELGLSFNGGTT